MEFENGQTLQATGDLHLPSRRQSPVRKPDAKWTLPNSKIEANERPTEAALREMKEETGLSSDAIGLLASHKFDRRAHVFRMAIPDTFAAGAQNEIADCCWISPSEVDDIAVKKPVLTLIELYVATAEGTLGTLNADDRPPGIATRAVRQPSV
jgi:8-oxo-dGTP diphosphatase